MTHSSEPIVVGIDGSVLGLRALDWAAAEARRAACLLRLVHAYQPAVDRAPGLPASTRIVAYENGQRILDAARRHLATGRFTDLEVAYVLYEGAPSKVLLDEAVRSRAKTLVIGSRGLGFFTRVAVGSTSSACAAHATLPLVVIPRGWTSGQPRIGRVVVGIDQADRCETALGYAFDYAQRHRFDLLAVQCWEPGNPYARDPSTRSAELESGEAEAEQRLGAALRPWQDKYPDVRVRTGTDRLHPATALVEHSRDTELLVLGGRRRGPVRGRIPPAVARGVLHHSQTPVAVVRC